MKVLLYPDTRLTAPNEPITQWTTEIAEKVAEMFQLMYSDNGVGLAGPQVGWNVNLFIINVTGKKEDERIYFNPTIKPYGRILTNIEGCLSFPGIAAWIKRPEQVEIVAETPNGKTEEDHTGLLSQAIQHEYDHLQSKLMIELMSPADYRRNKRTIEKLKNAAKR